MKAIKDFHFIGLSTEQSDQFERELKARYQEYNDGSVLKVYSVPDADLRRYVNYETEMDYVNLPND